MNKTLKLVLFLAAVSAISGLSIGFVNSITEPIINEKAIAAEKENLEVIFPGASFVQINYNDKDGTVLGAYEAKGQGFVFKATAKGYNSSTPIVAMVGVGLDGKVVNVVPLEQAETNGIGSKCFEEDNIKKLYIGKEIGQEIDSISGASYTSKALKTIIEKSLEAYTSVK